LQLDFNIPERFNLRYRGPSQSGESNITSQFERPVMIHRAILGSLERFIAIITENFAGKWYVMSPEP
jgi:threonyl-tRNA synthetase